MNFALPVKRLRETETLMAFYHPKPAYPVHILLVPKRAIASFEQLDLCGDDFASRFLVDVATCVQSLAAELRLGDMGYRLIVNAGRYQDFPQLHFHLISG
jgi:histidine triad (HIT) family protein